MRWVRRIFLAFLLLAGLHLLVWYTLIPRYAPALLERLITKLGVRTAKIGEVRIEWGALAVLEAELGWGEQSGDRGTHLSAREVELGFTLDSLRQRTFTSFRAAELAIRVPSSGGNSETKEEGRNLIQRLASIAVPFTEAEVRQLRVEQGAAPSNAMLFEGAVRWDDPSLTIGSGSVLQIRFGSEDSFTLPTMRLAEPLVLTKAAAAKFEIAPTLLELQNFSVPSVGRFPEFRLRFEHVSLAPERILGNAALNGNVIPAVPADSSAVAFTSSIEFEIQPQKHFMPEVTFELSVPEYAVGILLSDISLRGKLVPTSAGGIGRIEFSRAKLRTIGAELSSQPFSFLPGRSAHEITTKIKELNLQRIFEVYPQKKISGEGTLDGEVNVRLSKAGAVSATGALVSRPEGGVLRGDLSDWKQSYPGNRGIAIAAEALEQFRYTSLHADVEYQENGDLLLKIALKGANPDFNRGQQMNLNVSVEENLPALLKTMRYLR